MLWGDILMIYYTILFVTSFPDIKIQERKEEKWDVQVYATWKWQIKPSPIKSLINYSGTILGN